jgi:NAD(P)-dependent dehydrogenase (short-subunit alcohol dehydrogenase family)
MTRTVLVTGGNRGIGLEVVKGFATEGYKVLMACRDEDQGKEKLADVGVRDVHVIEMDLSSNQSIDEGFTQATAVFGDIDIIVNNAGILVDKRGIDASAEELSQSMQVHLNGPYKLIQLALPSMKENGFGRIINVSSGWGAFSEGLEGPLQRNDS